jgi:hypothetical protein
MNIWVALGIGIVAIVATDYCVGLVEHKDNRKKKEEIEKENKETKE